MKYKYSGTVLACICLLSAAVTAQRNFSAGSPVTENFGSFGTTSVLTTDNTTISGLYTRKSTDADGNATANNVVAGTGSVATSDLYHYGVAGTNAVTDRALGGIPGGAGVGDLSWGLRLVNNGVLPITVITLGYTGEHWRDGNGTNTIAVSYRISATAITDLTTGTYTAVPSLTYTPANPAGTGALDGNAPANRTVFAPTNVTLSAPLQPGQEIMIRWTLVDSSGPDHGLAIDDVAASVIGVTAGDATISGRVTDAYGRAISSAAISFQDITGVPRIVYTNTFGYYSVKGLEVGQTYILGVSARRYTFANPTMVVNLGDNVDGANFVASR